jgi:hypothetical protein
VRVSSHIFNNGGELEVEEVQEIERGKGLNRGLFSARSAAKKRLGSVLCRPWWIVRASRSWPARQRCSERDPRVS